MPAQENTTLGHCGNALLRAAIRSNLVTFPAQIPILMKPPSGLTQQRAVNLYFVRGWSVREICDRYFLGKKIVQNLLSDWRVRAITAGLIQEVHPEELERLAAEYASSGHENGGADNRPQTEATPASFRAEAAVATERALLAFEEDCAELGLELSPEQVQKIARILRSGAPTPGPNQIYGATPVSLPAEPRFRAAAAG